jgi:tryptophan-rich sensory protein
VVGVNLVQLPFGPNSWYQNLMQPPLSPPDWVFGLVWPILYLLIAISLTWWWQTRDFRNDKINKKIGWLFVINLLANTLYSPLTFGLENLWLGLVSTTTVAITSALLIHNLSKDGIKDGKKLTPQFIQSRLLGPYHLWALFATYLSFGYLILN